MVNLKQPGTGIFRVDRYCARFSSQSYWFPRLSFYTLLSILVIAVKIIPFTRDSNPLLVHLNLKCVHNRFFYSFLKHFSPLLVKIINF